MSSLPSRLRLVLIVAGTAFLQAPCTQAYVPPLVSPFLPLLMQSIPDPIVHVSVGTAASGMGSLAAYPLERMLQQKPGNILSLCIHQGLQLGVYSVLLAGTNTTPDPQSHSTLGRILCASLAGAASGPLKVFELGLDQSPSDGDLHHAWKSVGWFQGVLQISIARDVVIASVALPIYHALVLDGMQRKQ